MNTMELIKPAVLPFISEEEVLKAWNNNTTFAEYREHRFTGKNYTKATLPKEVTKVIIYFGVKSKQ